MLTFVQHFHDLIYHQHFIKHFSIHCIYQCTNDRSKDCKTKLTHDQFQIKRFNERVY